MSTSDEISRKLDDLWDKYLPTLLSRIENLAKAMDALSSGSLSSEIRINAALEAHKLAGSLGTFGLQAASEHALALESLLAAGTAIDQTQFGNLQAILGRIELAVKGR